MEGKGSTFRAYYFEKCSIEFYLEKSFKGCSVNEDRLSHRRASFGKKAEVRVLFKNNKSSA